jgi:hypothetical protein
MQTKVADMLFDSVLVVLSEHELVEVFDQDIVGFTFIFQVEQVDVYFGFLDFANA